MGSDVKIAFSYPYGDDLVEMKKWHFIDMCSCGCDGCYSKQMTPSTSRKEDPFAAIRVNLNAKAATAVIFSSSAYLAIASSCWSFWESSSPIGP